MTGWTHSHLSYKVCPCCVPIFLTLYVFTYLCDVSVCLVSLFWQRQNKSFIFALALPPSYPVFFLSSQVFPLYIYPCMSVCVRWIVCNGWRYCEYYWLYLTLPFVFTLWITVCFVLPVDPLTEFVCCIHVYLLNLGLCTYILPQTIIIIKCIRLSKQQCHASLRAVMGHPGEVNGFWLIFPDLWGL